MPHALLIVNRKSRSGAQALDAGLQRLSSCGWHWREAHAETPRDIDRLIRGHAGEVDCVILGGGDGTLRAAAEALVATGLPLGILPLGTANDLARTLGIPAEPLAACEIIAAGHQEDVDLGCVNGHYFFNAAGLGLGARVTRRLSRERKGRWGVLGYARTVIDALRASRSFSAVIDCDGHIERVRSIQIAVGNGRFYGGGMTIHAEATIADKRLDLYSLAPQSFWRLATLAPALRSGRASGRDDVLCLSGERIEIRTRRAKSVTTDGELTTHTPARFHVESGVIRAYMPSPEARDAT